MGAAAETGKTMAGKAANEPVPERLKAIRSRLAAMDDRMQRLAIDMRSTKGRMAGFLQAKAAQESACAAIHTSTPGLAALSVASMSRTHPLCLDCSRAR